MSPELTLLIGLLAVLALPGLLIGLADLLGPTETRHHGRTTDAESGTRATHQIPVQHRTR